MQQLQQSFIDFTGHIFGCIRLHADKSGESRLAFKQPEVGAIYCCHH